MMLRYLRLLFAVLLVASTVLAAHSTGAMAKRSKTYFHSIAYCGSVTNGCWGSLKVKPRNVKLYSSCGIDGLRWKRWGRGAATGRGTVRCRDWGGDPDANIDARGKMVLSKRTWCKDRYIYLSYRVTAAGDTHKGRNTC